VAGRARPRWVRVALALCCFGATGAARRVEAQASAASIAGTAHASGALGLSLTRTTRIEDPAHKLDPFYAALDASQRGAGSRRVTRIAYYGDSHVASDDYTGPLRALLQRRFGAAGLGFVLPARAERWYRRIGMTLSSPQGFRAERIRERSGSTSLLGVYGMALHADRGPATTRLTTSASDPAFGASHVRVYYATRADGGALLASLDERPPVRVSTAGAEGGFGRIDLEAVDGAHVLELRTEGDGPVTLYGAVLERDVPGVVLDMFGIPGARARAQLQWSRSLRRDMLAERDPQLVVLAYGTNEAGDEEPIETYEEGLRHVLTQLRADAPEAACLLVGPTDRPIRKGRQVRLLRHPALHGRAGQHAALGAPSAAARRLRLRAPHWHRL